MEQTYRLYKSSLYRLIDDEFGWDEVFQRERFFKSYKPDSFYWIFNNDDLLGLVSIVESHSKAHLHLLLLFPEHREKGHGKTIMKMIHKKFSSRQITLSSFRKNDRAIRFYERLGYRVSGGDESFLDLCFDNP